MRLQRRSHNTHILVFTRARERIQASISSGGCASLTLLSALLRLCRVVRLPMSCLTLLLARLTVRRVPRFRRLCAICSSSLCTTRWTSRRSTCTEDADAQISQTRPSTRSNRSPCALVASNAGQGDTHETQSTVTPILNPIASARSFPCPRVRSSSLIVSVSLRLPLFINLQIDLSNLNSHCCMRN